MEFVVFNAIRPCEQRGEGFRGALGGIYKEFVALERIPVGTDSVASVMDRPQCP